MGPACASQTRRAGRSRSGLLVSGTVVLRLDGACGPKCRLRSTAPAGAWAARDRLCRGQLDPCFAADWRSPMSLCFKFLHWRSSPIDGRHLIPTRPLGPVMMPPASSAAAAAEAGCGASPRVTVLSPHLRGNLAAEQDRASTTHGAPAVALPFSFAPGSGHHGCGQVTS